MTVLKPDAPSCARNRDPILEVLRDHLTQPMDVLEIASGTGQHAVYFAEAMPHLWWQCTDLPENLPGIALWLAEARLPNTLPAVSLDVSAEWPTVLTQKRFDAVFSANSLHIMSWSAVEALFAALPGVMNEGARLVVYGPFNYDGQFTSPSNADFEKWLKARNPESGIRDFEAVDALALAAGLQLIEDRPMPANNRCLVWQRR